LVGAISNIKSECHDILDEFEIKFNEISKQNIILSKKNKILVL